MPTANSRNPICFSHRKGRRNQAQGAAVRQEHPGSARAPSSGPTLWTSGVSGTRREAPWRPVNPAQWIPPVVLFFFGGRVPL